MQFEILSTSIATDAVAGAVAVHKGTYDLSLVMVSYVLASLASYTALLFVNRLLQSEVRQSKEHRSTKWLIAAATTMGLGIWSMHFVGMLAYRMDMPVTYAVIPTLISLLIAIGSCAIAIRIVTQRGQGLVPLVGSGLIWGSGIAGMHYMGMASMKMDAVITYDPFIFTLSIVIAIAASIAALWISLNLAHRLHQPWLHIGAALIMGVAICGMHYTGMAAATYVPSEDFTDLISPGALDHIWLAITVTSGTLFILCASLLAIYFDRKLSVEKEVGERLALLVEQRTHELQQQTLALLKSNELLEEANKVKDQFLTTMSHELRTPLNCVIGMTSLLLDTELDEEQHECLNMISDSGDHLLMLINDILDYSIMASGQLELAEETIELRPFLESTVYSFGPLVQEKRVELDCIIDPNLPEFVVCDSTRLRQVLVNLLGNAIKFTETGSVTTSVVLMEPDAPSHPEFTHLKLSVTDTGIGIPPEKTKYLFQSFSQVDSSISRKHGGTGLGLAICNNLAARMGGTIWVESKVGQGSTFSFTMVVGIPEYALAPEATAI